MNAAASNREPKAVAFATSVSKAVHPVGAEHCEANARTIHRSKRQMVLKPLTSHPSKPKKQYSCTKSTTTYYSRDTTFRLHDRIAAQLDSKALEADFNLLEYLNAQFAPNVDFKVRKSRSPLKVPVGFKTGAKLLRHSRAPPRYIDERPVSEKQKIVQNIYYKNDKYYYSNKIQFSTVLRQIYYENYKINDIKEYILPCFKRLPSVRTYFDILLREAKSFSDAVKTNISSKIERLVLHELTNLYDTKHSEKNYSFVPFSKDSKKYQAVVDLLYDNYRHLELINIEVEKLTRIYLENYIEKDKPLGFDTYYLHRGIFINNVYKDELINSFIAHTFDYFKQKSFYWNNYPKTVEKISEIYENLECNSEFDDNVAPNNDDYCDQDDGSSISLIEQLPVVVKSGNGKKAKKPKKKKKKAKKCADDDQTNGHAVVEPEEVESLYTLFCSRIDKANSLYAVYAQLSCKPCVVFDDETVRRFDKLTA